MASLMLLRHAKSDWGTGHTDHDRPLNARGRKAAAAMGRYLKAEGLVPDRIICSTAARARETLALVTEAGDLSCSVQYEPALYGADFSAILDVIQHDAGDVTSVLLVGHNPGFEDVARHLAEAEVSADAQCLRQKYPTCGLSVFTFSSKTLANATQEKASLDRFVTPKMLG